MNKGISFIWLQNNNYIYNQPSNCFRYRSDDSLSVITRILCHYVKISSVNNNNNKHPYRLAFRNLTHLYRISLFISTFQPQIFTLHRGWSSVQIYKISVANDQNISSLLTFSNTSGSLHSLCGSMYSLLLLLICRDAISGLLSTNPFGI